MYKYLSACCHGTLLLEIITSSPTAAHCNNKQTKMSILFFIFSLFVISAFAYSPRKATRKCTRELEAILHKPQTYELLYLEGLAREFKLGSPQIFASPEQADAFIYSFAQKYRIEVTLVPTFGDSVNYYPDGTSAEGSHSKYTDTAQSYLNFGGFVKQVSDERFFYTFSINSPDARRYGVTLSLRFMAEQI